MTDPSPDAQVSDLQQRVLLLEAEVQSRQQAALRLFSEAPAAYLLLTAQGQIEDLNAAACGLLGRTREALLGKRLSGLLPPASQSTLSLLLGQAGESALRHHGEVQLLHPDGPPLEVLLELNVDSLNGVFQAFRLVMTDITAYKQAHLTLLDHSASQEEQIVTHAAQVRALNQELDQVVHAFVQQLQLPVARALNFLQVLRRVLDEPTDEVNAPLLNLERSVQQVLVLMTSVSGYLQVRRMRVWMRRVPLEKVRQEALRELRPLTAERQVHFTHDPLPTVLGDSHSFSLMLGELLGNALKFTRPRETARIHILVRETEEEYLIGVEDNGVGFNMRYKHRLFQLFGRLHSSRDFEGTGVGLLTVRQVCERFGGRVWAEGREDQGATFWFSWPKQPTIRK